MKRRDFLKTMGFTLMAAPSSWLFNKVPFKSDSTKSLASFFDLSNVRLQDSPFKDAMDINSDYLLDLDMDRLLACFYETAGLKPKAPKYGGWENGQLQGHTLGHYLSACSLMVSASDNPKYQKRVDYIADELHGIQAKTDDGYIGGIPKGRKLWNEVASGKIKTENFALNGVWSPWYNLHKTYAGLRDAYLLTDNDLSKDVLVAYSDWAVNLSKNLNEQQFQKMLECEYGGMNEVMADVYGITDDKRYLKLAERFNHKAVFDPLAEGKDELEGLHSNTQVPKIIGAAREYELNESDRLKKVASFFWQEVSQKRSYVHGGNSYQEYFGKLGDLHKRIGKATTETCNTYNMLKLTEHLMEWQPDVKYMDYYERALYNHILSSIDSKTGQVTYFVSTDPGFYKTYSTPFHSFWCCRGTGMENHSKYGSAIYMHKQNDLYVNLFIPSSLEWEDKGVTINQRTSFPSSDRSTLEINSRDSKEFTLKIRRPYWAKSDFQVNVNGEMPTNTVESSGYLSVRRKWRDGDKVSIEAPKKIHVEPMPNDDSKVAIMHGPFVLAGALGKKWMHEPEPYATDNSEYFDTPSVDVPDLNVGNSEEVSKYISKRSGVGNDAMQFELKTPGMEQAIILEPFYKIDTQRYNIYWNI